MCHVRSAEAAKEVRRYELVRQGLYSLCTGEKTAVHSVNDRLGSDLLSTEETAVKTLNSVLAALDAVKLQVDVALRVRI